MRGIKKLIKRVLRFPNAKDPAPSLTNSLFYWRTKDNQQNFGDHLSSAIVTKMAAERDMFFDELVDRPRRLLAIGSILHFAGDDNVVWGSGFNGSVPVARHKYVSLDVRAVRGPLTKTFLEARGIQVPSIFGDPALLTERLLGNRFIIPNHKKPVVFVPNFRDLDFMRDWENVISPYEPWAKVITSIIASKHVISSSLHGLIIADSFNIPCTYLRLSEHEAVFKYEDYCLGAGRKGLKISTSRQDAIKATPLDPININLDELYNAFPWDLWD